MIGKLIKRGVKTGVAIAKFAVNEVAERRDKGRSEPNAPMPANPESTGVDEDFAPVDIMDVHRLHELLGGENPPVLLDCREQHEWEAGYISPCVHIPMNELPNRLDELSAEATTVVYCLHGLRSADVAAWLKGKGGFQNVSSLDGGIVAWYAEYNQDRIVVTRSEDH